MNEGLIARHNAVVQARDTVWHLGDFSLNERLVPGILARLNGQHHLMPGNHDRCHPCHKDKAAAGLVRYRGYGFRIDNSVPDIRDLFGDRRVTFGHFPSTDWADDRYPQYRPRVEDQDIRIHGHVHEKWKIRQAGSCTEVNVGVDVWNWAPVRLEDLAGFVMKGIRDGI